MDFCPGTCAIAAGVNVGTSEPCSAPLGWGELPWTVGVQSVGRAGIAQAVGASAELELSGAGSDEVSGRAGCEGCGVSHSLTGSDNVEKGKECGGGWAWRHQAPG